MIKQILKLSTMFQILLLSTTLMASEKRERDGLGENPILFSKSASKVRAVSRDELSEERKHDITALDKDTTHEIRQNSPLLSLPRDVLLKLLQYEGVAKACGTVCIRIEMLRSDRCVPLVTEFPNREDFLGFCINPVYAKSGMKFIFTPERDDIRFLEKIPQLVWLDLGRCGISPSTMQELAPELGRLTNLQLLDLNGNKFLSVGAMALAPELGKLINLRRLALSNTRIGDAGAIALAPELGKLDNLQRLFLRINHIGKIGMQALTPELGKLSNLQKVGLGRNSYGAASAQALIALLGSKFTD